VQARLLARHLRNDLKDYSSSAPSPARKPTPLHPVLAPDED
jgi:hypothetical protein